MVRLSMIVQAVKPRVSLIKFRKGGLVPTGRTEHLPVDTTRNAAIEDWELPKRYARKPIDQIEMEYINTGGAI
ncbi:uncharacterized protein LOC105219902 [Zeugodacus cucurbitae]|uniref:uncharacterized protein LOC105219902 n=1 Tax=Zeugodacus cucurbitae TaxID=28588 RepID=UPI000596A4F3|nr:uncharacterized protein LOC105219902 [Zeugodacus cucurbitae]